MLNYQQKFKQFIENELKRKDEFSAWQQLYAEQNKHLLEPKQLLRDESRRTLESQKGPPTEKESKVRDERRKTISSMKLKYTPFLCVLKSFAEYLTFSSPSQKGHITDEIKTCMRFK